MFSPELGHDVNGLEYWSPERLGAVTHTHTHGSLSNARLGHKETQQHKTHGSPVSDTVQR